jgi:hypothetical protein
LLEAQLFAPCSHGFTEFLEGLHLIFTSINLRKELHFDVNIKKCKANQA